ncbi:MAG: Stk1 family PASTA domain-containing Ser/Thr kinase [Actinomycetota bacterium]|nr:Stk1 family PASTA domain-containing Ser/Thr kinase [Actinomycetota bacterium]
MEQLVDNRYRIVGPLGAGGMAEVYLAHDDVLDRSVALKVMSGRYADDEEFVERFKREAQSAAALSHPNIVSIYDRGEAEDGTYYIAMEYLPGGTLKDRILKRGALAPRTAAAVALQIAEALRAAHAAGVVHRDIKPHNVLVTDTGDIKVGDFGIARAATSSTMTRTGSILGTAHYISPEQAMGEPVGQGSDLYSLGVVLYEMLTGTLPYDAETSIGIAMKHVNGHLVPPRELNPEVPEGINAVTTKLLAKSPEERYADADELIEDLERVLEGFEPAAAKTTRVTTRPTPAAGTAQTQTMGGPKRVRRQGRPWILFLLLLILLLGGLAYALLTLGPPRTVPDLQNAASIREAEQIAAQAGDFEVVEGARQDSEEPEGAIISQTPAAGESLREGSKIYVIVSGRQVAEVPDVGNRTSKEATQTLEEAGFEVEEEPGESSESYQGYVIDQDPRGGRTAEVGSTVTITVGAGSETVEVPDLSNRTVEEARRALEAADLSLGRQTRESSSRVPAGQVVSQNPSAGSNARSGSSVDITVSSGPNQLPVPDVVGYSVSDAVAAIWNAGFGYTVETIESTESAGTVLSTDPAGGTLLDPYSRSVTITQSSGPAAAPPPPPPSPPPAADKSGDSKSKSEGKGKKDN